MIKLQCNKCSKNIGFVNFPSFFKITCYNCKNILTIPKIFNSYLLLKEITKNENYISYKAIKNDDEKIIKIFDKKYIKSLENTYNKTKNLDHPNILKNSYKIDNEVPCLISDFIPLRSVEDQISTSKHLSKTLVTKIIEQIINALKYASENNIVHGNLTSNNILLRDDDNICISDFLVRKEVYLTNDKMHYQSLEALKNNIYDTNNDLYSLGILIYYLLTGTYPFKSDNKEDLIKLIEENKYKKVSSIRTSISKDIDDLLDKILSCNITLYPTYDEILSIIKTIPEKKEEKNKDTFSSRKNRKHNINASKKQEKNYINNSKFKNNTKNKSSNNKNNLQQLKILAAENQNATPWGLISFFSTCIILIILIFLLLQ